MQTEQAPFREVDAKRHDTPSLPRAGGPFDTNPTLFLLAFSLICLRIISAPGKSAWARRLFP